MAVNVIARDRLTLGLDKLAKRKPKFDYRQRYYLGDHDMPYAPPGVNDEYKALQVQSIGNWMDIAMDAPSQRLEVESLRRADGKVDAEAWNAVWVANRLHTRQRVVWNQMMVHGVGICGVSRNPANAAKPIVRPENASRVYLHKDPADPFTTEWALKKWTIPAPVSTSLVLPASASALVAERQVAVVYDAIGWVRFERTGYGDCGTWDLVSEGEHGLGEVPFAASASNVDADNEPHPAIDALIPMQDALNTIRFNALLAMQYSASRQRVFTGYDPVVRDAEGQIVWRKNPDGTPILDSSGQPMPVVRSPGRVGVDRALVLPGKDTKVYDLAESNLKNYIEVYSQFLSDLFAIGQIPPQYALTKMANLSGDALAGAESTLQALVTDLQREAAEVINAVLRLANRARGADDAGEYSVEWADSEARSFAQIVDAVVKLISAGFPREPAFEMLPGSNPTKVARWMELMREEQAEAFGAKMMGEFTRELDAPADNASADSAV